MQFGSAAAWNCHGFQAVVSDRKAHSEAACRRQDLSRVSHAPRVVLAVRHPTFRFAARGAKCLPSASPIRPRKTQVASEAFVPFAAFPLRPLRFHQRQKAKPEHANYAEWMRHRALTNVRATDTSFADSASQSHKRIPAGFA